MTKMSENHSKEINDLNTLHREETESLKDALNNMAYILSSIKYNDDIVENLLGDEKYNLSDNETYNIFKTKKGDNTNFLKYADEFDNYEGDYATDLIEKKEINQDKDN